MALDWQPLSGKTQDTIYQYLKVMEGAALTTQAVKIDNGGPIHYNPTIGVGYDLVAGGEDVQREVLVQLGFKRPDVEAVFKNQPAPAGTTAARERAWITDLENYFVAAPTEAASFDEVQGRTRRRRIDSRLCSLKDVEQDSDP